MMVDSLAVLIMSCDSYDDTWEPFFHFFDKYWPNCPYKLYFASNFRYPAHPRIQPVLFNQETNWSDELASVLARIPESHVMYIQDDYFLQKAVDNEVIDRLWKKMLKMQISYLRLFPISIEKPFIEDYDIGPISPDDPYLTSLQTAIWRKEYLASLLVSGESPWSFEMLSPARARETNAIFASVVGRSANPGIDEYPFYYFCTAILKGKWMRGAWKLCKDEGIILDLKQRKVESWWDINKEKVIERSPKFIRRYVSYIVRRI